MMRNLRISTLIALAAASRIERHDHTFGSSCDELHTSFSNRLATVSEQVQGMDPENLGSGTQARLAMRMYGIGRTLRRARTCAWMQDTDSDDMQQARGLAAMLLERSPCADAAQAEFAAGVAAGSDEEQAMAMQRAISISMSDTCEPAEISLTGEAEVDEAQIDDFELQVQDGIQDMMEEGGGSSFAEADQKLLAARFLRFLFVATLFILLLVFCVNIIVWIGTMIAAYTVVLLGMLGVVVTGALAESIMMPTAILVCGYDLFWRVLAPDLLPSPDQ